MPEHTVSATRISHPHQEVVADMGDVVTFPGSYQEPSTIPNLRPVTVPAAPVGPVPTEPAPGTAVAVRPGRIPPALVRVGSIAKRTPAATRAAVTSPQARFVGRHAWHTAGSVKDVTGQTVRAFNANRRFEYHITQQLAAAHTAGDSELIRELNARLAEHHAHRRELRAQKRAGASHRGVRPHDGLAGELLAPVAKAGGKYGLPPLLASTVIPGARTIIDPDTVHFWDAWMTEIRVIAQVTAWLWENWWAPLGVLGVAFAAMFARAYHKRLTSGNIPEALLRPADSVDAERIIPFTDGTIVRALADLGITKLTAAIKDGWPNRDGEHPWVQHPRQDGPGMAASIRLPGGVTVEKIQDARGIFAHNLGCLAAELLLSRNKRDATVLDIYRLNTGELRRPAPEHPLLHEGLADFFKGVPVGVTPFGKKITAHLFERNYVVAGIMGSGKTTLVLDILAGAALDPLVDLEVICFAANADYVGLDPVLDRRIQGNPLDVVEQARDRFAELQDDLVRRGEIFEQCGPGTVLTRELVKKHPELRPRVVVMDECQWFFRQDDPQDRREVVNAVINFITTARKYGIVLILVTPSPSDQSLPRDIVALTTNNACGAINDKRRNNIVLGENAHENGISALGLVPRDPETGDLNDTGTLITTGFTSAKSETLRTHYLTPADMALVVERAVRIRGGATSRVEVGLPEERDLLADVAEVMGDSDKVKATDVASRLRDLAPNYRPYAALNGDRLRDALGELGVKVTKSGVLMVYAARVQAALLDRDEQDREGIAS
ncbi:zonular occludens toxin domain-containing protein [Saccharopolyspora sp. NPDC000995]